MNPLDYASRICYSSREVLNFSYQMGLRYKNANGIFIEAGVAAGAQIIALAHAAPQKKIFAFDSFCGLPLPSNKDNQMPGICMLTEAEQKCLPDPGKQELKSSGAVVVSEEQFFDNLDFAFGDDQYNVTAVPGWFEETVPKFVEENPDLQIAILRLDGDLYNSTYVCLKHLYPKVIDGGCVIIDDIQLPGCKQAVIDYFAEIGESEIFRYVDNIAYFIKGPSKDFAV